MSADTAAEVAALARAVFAGAATDPALDARSGGALDANLWQVLDGAGLARLTMPERLGGSGGQLTDAAALLIAAGAAVPLLETDLLAGWLAGEAGLSVPDGPLSAVLADVEISRNPFGTNVSGVVPRAGWARHATALVLLTGGGDVVVLDAAQLQVEPGSNLAEEPRDRVSLSGARAAAVASVDPALREQFRLRAALGRALLTSGAAETALGMTVRHATERVQFGRPIAKLQAVQQEIAVAAAESAACRAATDAAVLVVGRHGWDSRDATVAVAAAKARTAEAAGVVARIAHQVHGAIGFTREHRLRLATTRLWAWREEDGSDAVWNEVLGSLALDRGPADLFALITGTG